MRWGLIGTGSICTQFAADLAHVPGAVRAAVASRDPARAAAFAAQHGFARAHGSAADLLADRGIDTVYIGTPHSEHLPQAQAALHAGKHVLCEKPLTVEPAQTQALMAAQRRTGRYLMEAMWTWFLPAVQQAQAWVAEGRIGTLVHVRADFGYPQTFDAASRLYDPALGGGCLLDLGVYPVALAWLFHKQMPDSLQVDSRHAPSGVDDDITAVLRYAGHTATIAASFRCKLPNVAWLVGTTGSIAIPDFWRAREAQLFELDRLVGHFRDERHHLGFAYEAIAVQQDIAAGRQQSAVVGLADSLAVQQLMAAIRSRFRCG